MAFAELRKELDCSVCLSVYTDPVNLTCGHNFCRLCIECVLDTQEKSGRYSCPECRNEYGRRPELQRNITLRNIVRNLPSAEMDWMETRTRCTNYIEALLLAVKSCLLCDHSKSPEHTSSDPTTSLENNKRSIKEKILKDSCTEDASFICWSCRLDGAHRRHQLEILNEEKETLRNVLQKFIAKRRYIEESIKSLLKRKRTKLEEATSEGEHVNALFGDLWRSLEDWEIVLNEISKLEVQLSSKNYDLIQQLEIRKDKPSEKISYIEKLCNMTVPEDSYYGSLRDTKTGDATDIQRLAKLFLSGGDLEVMGVSHTLHTGLSDKIMGDIGRNYIKKATNILLDINTTHNELQISEDRKMARRTPYQGLPVTPQRFKDYPQVLSSQGFSSGQCYWEVDIGGSECWIVGMCYPSIDKMGVFQSAIGHNDKSWCLYGDDDCHFVLHDTKVTRLHENISSDRVGVYLDYEAGQISFYELGIPIRHLHTFSATFTEPLHAALGVWGKGWVRISGCN